MSYIYLTLDTTPPIVNIYAPNSTDKEMMNEFMITSNDVISDYEFYIVDSNNIRRDYVLSRESDNELLGQISFGDYDFGIVTLFVRLTDDVGNISDVVTKTIYIMESFDRLRLEISDKTMEIEPNSRTINITVNSLS